MVMESNTDDSQASQLLAAALRPKDIQPGALLVQEPHTQDSPLLSDSNASVHYHIHGLAATQSVYSSQDQPYTEGSQKENTPASWDKDRSTQPLPPSPPASPPRALSYTAELKETPSNIFSLSKASKEKPSPKDFVPVNDPSSSSKSGKSASLTSPSRLPSRPQPHPDRNLPLPSRAMLPPPRPRSPSPPSQDSFAGPLPQPDPMKAFIATARNFNVPLSQVGEVSQSSEEDGPPPVSSGIWSSRERHSTRREPSPPPRILVAGTPSDSSRGSNSQSQVNSSQSQQLESHYGDSQYSDPFPQAQAQTDDYLDMPSPPNDEILGTTSRSGSSQPSSSYERLLADPFEDIPVATQIGEDITPPTQIVERTQLNSQVEDMDSVMREHHYYNDNSQMVFPTVPSEARSTHTSHSTVSRGLLGMMAPGKRHRYAHIASEAAGPSNPNAAPRVIDWAVELANDTQGSDAPSSDGVHTQDTQLTDQQDDVGETQPSDVAVNGSVASLLPRRRLPPANRVLQPDKPPSWHTGPAAARVPEPDVSLDPDETGPTQIVSPSPDKTGPTQIVSPSPDKTGPTQFVSPSPAETGPTELASPLSDRTGPTQLVSPSPEKTGPTQIVSPSPAARMGRTQMFSWSPAKSSPTKVVPDSDPPEPALVAPPSRRRGPSMSPATTYHSPEVTSRARAHMQSEDEVLKTIAATEPSVPTIDEEQEEQEEQEEDIPLAQRVPSAKMKGKQKAKGPEVKSPAARNTIARGNAANSSWRGGVIPSSDPGERREEAAPKAKNTKPRTPMSQVPPPPPMSRSTRAAKTAARGRLAESSDSEEDQNRDDDDMSSLTEVATTVPADDDDDEMDVDLPDPKLKPVPARGNKRKRTVSGSAARKANGRVLVKEESSTPLGRPAKRIKTEGGGSDAPTRVFALWKGTAKYYTAIVHQSVGHGSGRYVVRFDDDDCAELELKHLRACRPQPGDHVLLRQKEKAIVVECPPCPEAGYAPDDTVTVELKDDEQEEVQVQCLQIALRTVQAEWDDRVLAEDAIVPVVRPNVVGTTPGRRSVSASGQSEVARKRALVGIGLVVSLAPSKEAQSTRDAMVGDIKKCGGVVLDDWTTIFGMEGALEHKNQRWMLGQGDVQWRKKAGHGIDKVFLISDDFHQKPKYLVALALGIPCLSVDWLRAFVEQEAEWRPHLLPAGYSEQLEARVSQMVDVDWGTSDHHLTNVAANKVAAKVFSDMSILCISADFVPSKKSKKSGDSALKKEAAESVPRIVLCMGAATVESVADLKHASQDPSEYDYIVVPDQNLSKYSKHENAVDVHWVKDCLISSRLLPLPG